MYIPVVNYALYALCIMVICIFRTTDNLGAAYGAAPRARLQQGGAPLCVGLVVARGRQAEGANMPGQCVAMTQARLARAGAPGPRAAELLLQAPAATQGIGLF